MINIKMFIFICHSLLRPPFFFFSKIVAFTSFSILEITNQFYMMLYLVVSDIVKIRREKNNRNPGIRYHNDEERPRQPLLTGIRWRGYCMNKSTK